MNDFERAVLQMGQRAREFSGTQDEMVKPLLSVHEVLSEGALRGASKVSDDWS